MNGRIYAIFYVEFIIFSKALSMANYSDEELRSAVNAVFDAYDTDKSGTLEANEITKLINDALKHMGQNRQVTQGEVKDFIAAVDKNSDGKVAKPELF